MTLRDVYHVGGTEIRIEGDLLFARTRGALVPEAATLIVELYQQMIKERGRYFLLADMSETGEVPPALRRQVVVGTRAHPPVAAAFYGGSLATRAMNALLMSALNLLSGRRLNLASFSSEEQARQWLAAERQRLDQVAAAKTSNHGHQTGPVAAVSPTSQKSQGNQDPKGNQGNQDPK